MLEHCRITGFADEIAEDIKEQIALLKELGQEYIELRSAGGKGIASYTLEEAEELYQILNHSGIKVSAIGSPIGKIDITADFAPHFALFCHVVQLAHIFHTNYIRMFSFFIPDGEDAGDYRDEVLYRMGQFVEYAGKNQVILLHENEKKIYGDTPERCLELMTAFYGSSFQCTFDFANFIQTDTDALQAYDLLKPYIRYIHVKDALKENHAVVPAGHGDGCLEEIFMDLHQYGYQGYLSLEPHLADFTGFHNLEKEAQKKTFQDGKEAYRYAFHEMMKLINGRNVM